MFTNAPSWEATQTTLSPTTIPAHLTTHGGSGTERENGGGGVRRDMHTGESGQAGQTTGSKLEATQTRTPAKSTLILTHVTCGHNTHVEHKDLKS